MSEDANTNSWASIGETPAQDTKVTPEDVGMDKMDTGMPVDEEQARIQAEVKAKADLDKAQEELQELQKHTCPKCSWDIRNKVLKAREEDLKEYVRCIVAGRPFVKDIAMFDGRLNCRFVENSDSVREIITDLVKTIPLDNATELEFVTNTRKIQVLYSLQSIHYGDDKSEFKLPHDEDVKYENAVAAIAEFDKRFGGRSASVQGIVFRAYLNFDRLLQVLSDGAFDGNFYQGAGLV